MMWVFFKKRENTMMRPPDQEEAKIKALHSPSTRSEPSHRNKAAISRSARSFWWPSLSPVRRVATSDGAPSGGMLGRLGGQAFTTMHYGRGGVSINLTSDLNLTVVIMMALPPRSPTVASYPHCLPASDWIKTCRKWSYSEIRPYR